MNPLVKPEQAKRLAQLPPHRRERILEAASALLAKSIVKRKRLAK